jgi:hypothetical protein
MILDFRVKGQNFFSVMREDAGNKGLLRGAGEKVRHELHQFHEVESEIDPPLPSGRGRLGMKNRNCARALSAGQCRECFGAMPTTTAKTARSGADHLVTRGKNTENVGAFIASRLQ